MTAQELQEKKEEFIRIYKENITRPGADKLLEYLLSEKSDFFTAPASTRYHGAYEGGLLEHSLNVYHCLHDYLQRPRVKEVYGMEFTEENIAIAALLHDLCKMNFYTVDYRNSKNAQGVWEKVPYYKINDQMPYGHGEKSVYLIQFFMHLRKEEAFAIRWHMGFSGPEDANLVGQALEKYPLAFALCTADMEASYFMEGSPE
ncbi:MAG: HD domain-containing protein [Oscillospiraceae bacterium]|nr:HD domain-containing protein [Oscillospiraceae bacterium]